MATKKTVKSKKNTNKNTKKKQAEKVFNASSAVRWILLLVAVLMLLCLIFTEYSGFLGYLFHSLLLGLFSIGAFCIPIALIFMVIYWKKDYEQGYIKYRVIFAILFTLNISTLYHCFTGQSETFNISSLWSSGMEFSSGGVFGGLLGSALYALIGKPGLIIVTVIMILVFGIFLAGFTPHVVASSIISSFKDKRENKKERESIKKIIYEDKPEPEYPDNGDSTIVDEPTVDPAIFERIMNDINAQNEMVQNSDTEIEQTNEVIGEKKFDDAEGKVVIEPEITEIPITLSEEIEIDRHPLEEEKKKPKKKVNSKYIFPPVSLLSIDKAPKADDITEELRTNANKLVDTLNSFKVRTTIINISRGPTITRYELAPEEGVRVKSISNLVDDISLSLASSGIRIEAPIPGKSAVGIEVPNKNVETVYLRELIESKKFKESKSRITVSLGMDVAGAPIFVDIAKMPHLLIAGATGMGKSVCINSMICSLLYKATPDEVKLILIDPKKVELNIYNNLPHLLIPVVSDPKKAAGSLQWAVSEMERRFALIEDVGVRDIYNYNIATKDDDNYEFMPHVVIIIDELADLMMTAPDSVEDSICRLAQKARAAGMHLIIGTQRPSVDVITGLIKANIPSRIAFTVASQIDSRTILDTTGAEKLIGRGDMLYAPVGASKPIRVQGAFVSESEVEEVTKFIKENSVQTEYDTEVIEQIDREAAKCITKKGTSAPALQDDSDNDEPGDPLLDEAIKIAVEAQKISTSLLQRKLSIGYGRAAKLVDMMEHKGIVSAPDGNKPRRVLINETQYLEMTMRAAEANMEKNDIGE